MAEDIAIYTDGAARGNPGKGGYGAVLIYGTKHKEISAGYILTTNNRMELMAVIKALELLKRNDIPVKIYTDSRYVCDAIEKGWLHNWVKKNFAGKKNADLWRELIPLLKTYKPKFIWVKGHNGHPLNERCDQLATQAADSGRLHNDEGYLVEKRNEGNNKNSLFN